MSEDTPQLATASLHARSALCSCAKVAHVQPRAPVATGAPILEQSASSNPAHHSPTNLDTRMLAMRVRAHGPPEALLMELVDVPRPGPHQLLVCPSAILTPHARARTARSVRSQRTPGPPGGSRSVRAHARSRRATSARGRSAPQAWAYALAAPGWHVCFAPFASRRIRSRKGRWAFAERVEVVQVRVMASGVNPVDAYIRSGNYSRLPPLPYTPGAWSEQR